MKGMISMEINSTVREMRRLMDDNLRRRGLTHAQIHVLGFLDMKRESGETCSQTDIRRECCNTRSSSVTSLLQTLEREGFVSREAGKDARTKQIVLTEKGLCVAHECKRFAAQVEEAFMQGFTREESAAFGGYLAKARANLERFAESIKE